MSLSFSNLFDTRDTKPRVFPVLLLLGVALTIGLVSAVPTLQGLASGVSVLHVVNPPSLRMAVMLLMVCFGIIVALLIRLFFEQMRYNPYSYNTIYYSGFSLFFLSVTLTYASEVIRSIVDPDTFTAYQVVSDLLYSARTYLLFSFPFILGFAVALCVSNVALIRHEGTRLVNILGILLSVALVVGNVSLFVFGYSLSGSLEQVRFYDLLLNLYATIGLYVECMVIGSIIANTIVSHYEPAHDKDYLIVLGCGIRSDGTPTPLLAGRIDRALHFWQEQLKSTGKAATFVTSGGQGPDEIVPESTSMKTYLVNHGVPERLVLEESRSTSTFENMRFSKEIIDATSLPSNAARIAFSTTNYHVFRSGLFARRVKMRAVGMGARTRWWFWPNAAVREFVGLLTEHRGKQALILGGMACGYALLTYLYYAMG